MLDVACSAIGFIDVVDTFCFNFYPPCLHYVEFLAVLDINSSVVSMHCLWYLLKVVSILLKVKYPFPWMLYGLMKFEINLCLCIMISCLVTQSIYLRLSLVNWLMPNRCFSNGLHCRAFIKCTLMLSNFTAP